MRIGIVGTGRMGSVISKCLALNYTLTLYNRSSQRAKVLADELKAQYVDEPLGLSTCEVILLSVPADQIATVAAEVAAFCKTDTIIVNTATKAFISTELRSRHPHVYFVDAKIIGHAGSMEFGQSAYVIIDASEKLFKPLKNIFSLIGTVERGDSKLAPTLSTHATEVGIRAAVLLKSELAPYHLAPELEKVLIESIGAGTMKAYINGDLGHFGQEIARRIEAEIGVEE